jgi:1,4-dihydroxy-2-naphthoyl-CoA hydrolase
MLEPAMHHFGKAFAGHARRPEQRGGFQSMTPLEKLHSMPMPFAQLKGVTFTEADKDRVVARMLVRPDLCTLGHALHGGAIMALADSVGAAATLLNLPEDAKGTTTIESKTNFIGGAREGMTVIATATPVHRGRRTQVWQTRLETEEGKLVAVVTQTQMVLV